MTNPTKLAWLPVFGFFLLLLVACTPIVAPAASQPAPAATPSSTIESTRASAPVTATVTTTETVSATAPQTTIIQAECSFAVEDQADVAALLSTQTLDLATFLHWYCAGAGVGDIRIAYTIAAQKGIPVEEVFDLFFSGVGWGKIQQQFGDADSPEQAARCLEEHANHDEVNHVAAELGLPVEEVLIYFCADLGFGEIRNAYRIHVETGAPMEEIFVLLRAGQEWGEIRKALGANQSGDPSGND